MRSPFELQSLIDWLDKQPARGKYDYSEPQACLICQYFDAIGIRYDTVDPYHWRSSERGDLRPLPEGFNDIAQRPPWTFGGALVRARALSDEVA